MYRVLNESVKRVCFGQLCPHADTLPYGAHCSFEPGSCGWSTSSELSSWRRVSGEELEHSKDMLGTALQNTQGKWCKTHQVTQRVPVLKLLANTLFEGGIHGAVIRLDINRGWLLHCAV